MKVTPWDVGKKIDYKKLISEFGVSEITDVLLKELYSLTKEEHFFLNRKIFYAHTRLDDIIKSLKKGETVYLYTGRAPSGPVHLGHLIVWYFTKWLQDKLQLKLIFQIPDEEKFFFKKELSLDETKKWAYENLKDIIAVGFDPEKTIIIIDTESKHLNKLYSLACQVAKRTTISTLKSLFGFKNENNVGQYFYTTMQSAPCFLPSLIENDKIKVLIPCAIDQDVHFRLTRDVAEKIGFPKPATILSKFLPSLSADSKMSTSKEGVIWADDDPKTVKKKIMKYAFSGGQPTIEEHRKKGGNPDIDISYQWLTFLEEDDNKLKKIRDDYKKGLLLSGELKLLAIEKINSFLKNHQERKKEINNDIIKKYLE